MESTISFFFIAAGVFGTLCLISLGYLLFTGIKTMRDVNRTKNYLTVNKLLDDYWDSLDKDPRELAVIRYNAYKKNVLKNFRIYEFEFDKWKRETFD